MHVRMLAAMAALMLVATMASAADFNDNDYHEYILYDVDTADIDVLIVPPESPYYARDVANIERSVQAWDDGINALGPAWLADGITIHEYTLGYDTPPAAALADPEIIIISAEVNPVLLFGIGASPQMVWPGLEICRGLSYEEMTFHQHEGSPWSVTRNQCDDGGYQCFVLNTNFLWLPDLENEIYMYDLSAHEVGHCLGIGHVGDALDFEANNYPEQDIMSYQHNPNQVHCVSTLNIVAFQAVYGHLLGQEQYSQPADTFVHMNPGQYSWVDCSNPNNPGWLDVLAATPLVHDHPAPGSTIGGNGGPTEPPEPAAAPSDLSASKGQKGKNHVVDLAWANGGGTVDVVLNGNTDATISNSGSYTDNLGKSPSGSYTYQICNAGTADCSNLVTVTY